MIRWDHASFTVRLIHNMALSTSISGDKDKGLSLILDKVCRARHPVLNLSHQGLKVIPSEISTLTFITTLLLNDNNIIMPPEEITYLNQLEHLSLEHNQLTLLPSNIHTLSESIRFLNLSHNPMMYVPPSLSSLCNLKELWLGFTGLTCFPREVCHLAKLEKLSLEGNSISEIKEDLSRLDCLTWLSLAKNCLRELGSNCQHFHLRDLQVIILAENQLAEFPTFLITNLLSLQYIDLRKNKIAILPMEIMQRLSNSNQLLAKLDLRDNLIGEVDETVAWKKTEHILLSS